VPGKCSANGSRRSLRNSAGAKNALAFAGVFAEPRHGPKPETESRGGPLTPDEARLAAARREVQAFAHERHAEVTEESPGHWRIEREPAFFKLGIYRWTAELKADGGLLFSERQWRPDPS